MIPPRRLVAAAAPLALLLTLAACSGSSGDGRVSSEELVKQVTAMLTEQVGRAPDTVECPDPLDAKVGAKVRCSLTDGGVTYGISVTATGVTDGKVTFDAEVDQQPTAG